MAEKEYIERGALERDLQKLVKKYNRNCESDKSSGAFEALYRLRLAHAADVVEVNHGRWLYVGGSGRYAEYECSECFCHVCFDENIDGTIPKYKGCPHCLAKMDGGKTE